MGVFKVKSLEGNFRVLFIFGPLWLIDFRAEIVYYLVSSVH